MDSSPRFRFGVRPHVNGAQACRYFDRLARHALAGRAPSPGEARALVSARRAYVRCCVGYAATTPRLPASRVVIGRAQRRPRERRASATRSPLTGSGASDQDEPAQPPFETETAR